MSYNETICYCSNISKREIIAAIESGAKTLQDIRDMTKACTVGRCKELSPRKQCCSGEIVKILDEYIKKPKVAFICVHNSCRSQIAEALGKHLAGDVFESYSAGTETKDRINPDAVRLMKEIYGIDMEQTQRPKLLSDIPPVDIVITMGCNVSCPTLPCMHREDWGLDDPSGKSDASYFETITSIEQKIKNLANRINP